MIFRTIKVLISAKSLKKIPKFKILTETNRNMSNVARKPPEFLNVGESRTIAYRKTSGTKSPGVIFLCGYMSNMWGEKALVLEKFCQENNHSFVRFDFQSNGESPGEFKDITLGHWKNDALAVLDKLTDGPQILVGSSMGAWLMLLAAMERPQRIHSLVGISAAVNFTRKFYNKMPESIKNRLETGDVVVIEGPYGDYKVTKKLIEESDNHLITPDQQIPITCPVRLLHGMKDTDVPYQISVSVGSQIASKDVDVILRCNSSHRFSEPQDLKLLVSTVKSLIENRSV